MGKAQRKSLLLRVPLKTWKAIKKQADAKSKSVTAEIVEILEDSQIPTGGAQTASSGAQNTFAVSK